MPYMTFMPLLLNIQLTFRKYFALNQNILVVIVPDMAFVVLHIYISLFVFFVYDFLLINGALFRVASY